MSKTRRDIQEQLQKDEVAESLQNIADFFRQNSKQLIVIAVVAVVGFLIIFGLRSHRENVLAETNNRFAMVLRNYQSLASITDDKERDKALKEVVSAADTLADAYPDTKLGREAIYVKGNALYQCDKFADAEKAYDAYLAKATSDEERAKAEIAIGYAMENESFFIPSNAAQRRLDKMNVAETHYQKAMELATGQDKSNPAYPYLYYYGLLCMARLNELRNDKVSTEKAIAIYQQIMKDRPVPVPTAKEKENRPEQDMLTQLVRRQLEEAEGQLSFQATAKLRLDRLQAAPEKGPAKVTTEVKASAAPTTASQTAKR